MKTICDGNWGKKQGVSIRPRVSLQNEHATPGGREGRESFSANRFPHGLVLRPKTTPDPFMKGNTLAGCLLRRARYTGPAVRSQQSWIRSKQNRAGSVDSPFDIVCANATQAWAVWRNRAAVRCGSLRVAAVGGFVRFRAVRRVPRFHTCAGFIAGPGVKPLVLFAGLLFVGPVERGVAVQPDAQTPVLLVREFHVLGVDLVPQDLEQVALVGTEFARAGPDLPDRPVAPFVPADVGFQALIRSAERACRFVCQNRRRFEFALAAVVTSDAVAVMRCSVYVGRGSQGL